MGRFGFGHVISQAILAFPGRFLPFYVSQSYWFLRFSFYYIMLCLSWVPLLRGFAPMLQMRNTFPIFLATTKEWFFLAVVHYSNFTTTPLHVFINWLTAHCLINNLTWNARITEGIFNDKLEKLFILNHLEQPYHHLWSFQSSSINMLIFHLLTVGMSDGWVKRIENLIRNLPTDDCTPWMRFCLSMTSRNDGKSRISSLSVELWVRVDKVNAGAMFQIRVTQRSIKIESEEVNIRSQLLKEGQDWATGA